MIAAPSKISVEVDFLKENWEKILDVARQAGQPIRVTCDGQVVATLQPAPVKVENPLRTTPELKATYIAEDAFAPLTEDEWPEDCR